MLGLCTLFIIRTPVIEAVVNRTKRHIPSDAGRGVREVFWSTFDIGNFVAEFGESLGGSRKDIVVYHPAPNKNMKIALFRCFHNGDWYRERRIPKSLRWNVELSPLDHTIREVKVCGQSIAKRLPIYLGFGMLGWGRPSVLVRERKIQFGSLVIDDSFGCGCSSDEEHKSALNASQGFSSGVVSNLSRLSLFTSRNRQVVSISAALFHFTQGIFSSCGVSSGNGELTTPQPYRPIVLMKRLLHYSRLLPINTSLNGGCKKDAASYKHARFFSPIGGRLISSVEENSLSPQGVPNTDPYRNSWMIVGVLAILFGGSLIRCSWLAYTDSSLFAVPIAGLGIAGIVVGFFLFIHGYSSMCRVS